MDRKQIVNEAARLHVKWLPWCRSYNVEYKTFMGWLYGNQKTMSDEQSTKVAAMLAAIGIKGE
jgi:hypothetical protein